jgi:transcriptional regulator with XRE-family HTH domain
MTLGERIRQHREHAHISQAELARRIGISKNAMNAIEAGDTDPRASRIVAIAQVLGVSTDTLLLDLHTPGTRKRTPTASRQGPRKGVPAQGFYGEPAVR